MKRYFFLPIIILLFSCAEKRTPADMVILGGNIYTANKDNSMVEAVAVIDDKIVYAGNVAGVEKFKDESTQLLDLEGKTMTPGFIEGHAHFFGVGYFELDLDLMKAKNYDEIVEMVRLAAEKAEPGQWILGRGWHQDKWDHLPENMIQGFQTHDRLSAVSPNNPVALEHASGHAVQVNAKAMEIAGVNQLSKESARAISEEGGEIIRDKNGNPTGIFNELATGLIYKHMPVADDERDRQAIDLAIKACLRNGITSFHDAGVTRRNIELFRQAKRNGLLGVRLYLMLGGDDKALVHEWLKRGPEIDSTNWLTIRSIKLYCDGALGSRGAWLLEPYTDRVDFYGMSTLSMDSVVKISRLGLKNGFQVCSHAIGDRANREILDRYEIAFKENSEVIDHRFRIEHAQHLHPNDIPRFAQLGVLPAMQAVHMSSDRPWAIDRLGEKRIKDGAYMWQSLLKTGAKVINGTDAPVEPINPIASFYASVSRRTLKGEPEGGYEAEEKMTREQALISYTLDAAYGAFEEKIKGSIEVGKLADFTIFSQDIMTVEENDLLKTEVMMTVVGGKILFKK
ncbi:MAG: amidohydrolase [Bacteroidia bacterium]|nr:amidohydrolase [Bacteroidia bacterium]